MTYTPNVPQATQTIAFTQPIIEANFQYIDTAMKIDHAWNGNEINSQADGSHQKISLPNQPTDIASLSTGIASVIYAIEGTSSLIMELNNLSQGLLSAGILPIHYLLKWLLLCLVTASASLFSQTLRVQSTSPMRFTLVEVS